MECFLAERPPYRLVPTLFWHTFICISPFLPLSQLSKSWRKESSPTPLPEGRSGPKVRLVLQGPPVSDPLAHVQPGPGEGGGVFPHLAGKSFGAVTALEDLQAVGAFLALLGANFALPQHRLADFRPEVASAAVALRAVGRAQARVALVTCR